MKPKNNRATEFISELTRLGVPKNLINSSLKDGVYNPRLVSLSPKEVLVVLENKNRFTELLPYQWEKVFDRPWGTLRQYCKAMGENELGETLYRLTVPVKDLRASQKKSTRAVSKEELLEYYEMYLKNSAQLRREFFGRPRLIGKKNTPLLPPEEIARLVMRNRFEEFPGPFRMPAEYWEKLIPGSTHFLTEVNGEYACLSMQAIELRKLLIPKEITPHLARTTKVKLQREKEKLRESRRKESVRKYKEKQKEKKKKEREQKLLEASVYQPPLIS